MNSTTQQYTDIALTHIKRLNFALEHLKSIMPVDENSVTNMTDQQFMYFEVLTNRFGKLQDYLGNKIFDLCLEVHKESTHGMSMIDKLNKLEKIGIINDAELWDQLRDLRNHLTHEYPNHPELTAKYLNYTYKLAPQLIDLTHKIISSLTQAPI